MVFNTTLGIIGLVMVFMTLGIIGAMVFNATLGINRVSYGV